MSSSSSTSKTCFVCGLEKPMNAFLQIAGPEGASYGNVCATCRGSGLGKKVVLPDQEDTGSSSTGLKIDAKAKLQLDLDKKNEAERQKELNEKEQRKREGIVDAIGDKKEDIASKERKHRQDFIEPKKDSFLNYQSKKPERADKPFSEKEIVEQANLQGNDREKNASIENQGKQDASKKDFANSNVDLTNVYLDPTITGQIRFQSAELSKIKKSFLSGGAAIGTIERQMEKILGGEHATNANKADNTNQTKSADAPNATVKQAPVDTQNKQPAVANQNPRTNLNSPQNAPNVQPQTPTIEKQNPVTNPNQAPARQSVFNTPVQQKSTNEAAAKTQLFNTFLNNNFQDVPPPPPPKTPTNKTRRGR